MPKVPIPVVLGAGALGWYLWQRSQGAGLFAAGGVGGAAREDFAARVAGGIAGSYGKSAANARQIAATWTPANTTTLRASLPRWNRRGCALVRLPWDPMVETDGDDSRPADLKGFAIGGLSFYWIGDAQFEALNGIRVINRQRSGVTDGRRTSRIAIFTTSTDQRRWIALDYGRKAWVKNPEDLWLYSLGGDKNGASREWGRTIVCGQRFSPDKGPGCPTGTQQAIKKLLKLDYWGEPLENPAFGPSVRINPEPLPGYPFTTPRDQCEGGTQVHYINHNVPDGDLGPVRVGDLLPAGQSVVRQGLRARRAPSRYRTFGDPVRTRAGDVGAARFGGMF